ncbi:UDP-N-acetylglucosamine 2-epimerase [Desulfovibrio aminophilus]|uniref:UDP-N-acetylglucosamine 2-epimerase n=1 Tax=Desulfovibrio aminophilus TaxID=81425 RepID=UPI000405804F|nr:UDP-N-acetylglucosamine 2-epimerase [Desulfovibrio aminophilus]
MRIAVFTGTRAEYGLLRPVLERLRDAPDAELLLLVSGSHLSARHGHTVDEIRGHGFEPDAEITLDLDDDSPQGVARAAAQALAGCAEALARLKPDRLLILGDRYEALACAVAASLCRVPIAHIHGGEVTRGAVDDQFRHALAKLAALHFTACEEYRRRVIQMGERPEAVFNVGSLGVENALTLSLPGRAELEAELQFCLGPEFVLVTFHPVTLDADPAEQARSFFAGLALMLDERPELRAVITGANADAGGGAVDALTHELVGRFPGRILARPSLGQVRYLSAMKHCRCVAGNSSSGVIEAPSFGVPTVNVGSRQDGRVRAASVLDCPAEAEAVALALRRALSGEGAALARSATNPLQKDGTSRRIVDLLISWRGGLEKVFHDILA